MKLRRTIVRLLAVGLVAGCGRPPPAPTIPARVKPPPVPVHATRTLRRVCMQNGLGLPGTGGGSIVFFTGFEGPGAVGIDTLSGEHVPSQPAEVLCLVTTQRMR